jgi:segregation and condensation protein B
MEDQALLKASIQALVFSSPVPIGPEDLAAALNKHFELTLNPDEVNELAAQCSADFEKAGLGFELVFTGGGYQFLTRPDLHEVVSAHLQLQSKKKLSQAALETLSIIAYRQPVTKSEIEFIRGVNCDYAIQKLLDRQLITLKGKSNGPGRPVLYGTSDFFMDYFGINTLSELPQLKEIQPQDNSIGEPQANS